MGIRLRGVANRIGMTFDAGMSAGSSAVIEVTSIGLYCPAGDFFIDPGRGVKRAIITHAHSDHARRGSQGYLCAEPGWDLLAHRLGRNARIETLPYGKQITIGSAKVSLHPAGHILGSSQVRIEVNGDIWVVSGDYNSTPDLKGGTDFEVVECDTFISECTFGDPVYRWPTVASVFAQIHQWWAENARRGITSVLSAYALGKSQRILAHIEEAVGPIGVIGDAVNFSKLYRRAGVHQAQFAPVTRKNLEEFKGVGLVIASSMARKQHELIGLHPFSRAFASGWMATPQRRQRGLDQGFVLSDHADWDGLTGTIEATGARRVGLMHGDTGPIRNWLNERGCETFVAEPPRRPARADRQQMLLFENEG